LGKIEPNYGAIIVQVTIFFLLRYIGRKRDIYIGDGSGADYPKRALGGVYSLSC